MNLSWADRRLGAVDGDDLSVCGAAAVAAPERAMDLHAMRTADPSAGAGAGAAPVTSDMALRQIRETYNKGVRYIIVGEDLFRAYSQSLMAIDRSGPEPENGYFEKPAWLPFKDARVVCAAEPWEAAWKRSLYIQRALRDRRYCEQIRDAKAAGTRPATADEFFARS